MADSETLRALTVLAIIAIGAAWSARREFGAPFGWALAAAVGVIGALGFALRLAGIDAVTAGYLAALVLVCAQIAETDRRAFIVPNLLVILLIVLAISAPFAPDHLSQLAGAALAGGIFLAVRTVFFKTRGTQGLGLGDVKLAAAMGALLGPYYVLIAVAAAAGVTAAALILTSRTTSAGVSPPHARGPAAPFGIGLAAALAVTILVRTWP